MGLNSTSHKKRTYLSIVNGKIAQKVEEGTSGAVSRKNKNEQVIHELLHDSVSGRIKEMKIEQKTFSGGKTKQLEILMDDIGDAFILTLPVDSKFFDQFASKIGNANLEETIEITPYSFTPKGEAKKKSGLNLYQGGNKLGYFFSKENPMGKPFPPEEQMDEEEYRVFKIKERKFYCDYIMGKTAAVVAKANQKIEPSLSLPDDGLPF